MSGIWLPTLDPAAGPKYLAILRALTEDVRSGRLAPGTRLPAQRTLAQHLDVDLTTVTRAFNEARRAGLIEAAAGRGSFVRGLAPAREPAAEARDTSIDFSMIMPPQPAAARLAERLSDTQVRLAASPGFLARLHYQDSAGARTDRLAGAQWLGQRLEGLSASRLVVAAGAQAALAATVSAVLAPGQTLCLPALTYPGIRMVAERRRLRLVPLAIDQSGIIPEAFAEACRAEAPRALYLVPTIDNPTAATLPHERRLAIAEIARRHGVAIIEDDAYGALLETPAAPLASLAPDLTWHIATLSKCVSPALRIAYVAAPTGADATRLAAELRAISLMASPLTASIASQWIADGELDAIIAAIRTENVARQALARRILGGLDYAAEPAGPHLWLALPPPWDRARFGALARQLGLSVVASDAFALAEAPEAVRLSLGAAPDREAVERGLGLLATLLAQAPGAVSTIV